MKAVVLAAGEGNRMWPLTETRPKPMLPVANKPLLEHVLESLAAAGIDDVVLVVGYRRERIQSYFGDGNDWDLSIEYASQEKQLGTGHAVLQAEPYVEGEFVALNGDRMLSAETVEKVVEQRKETGETTIAVIRSERPSDYGVVELEGEAVRDIVEKPPRHATASDLVNAGVYGFDESIFEAIRRTEPRGELAITDTLKRLTDDGRVVAVRVRDAWQDVSFLWNLLSVNGDALEESESGAGASVDASATVDETATLGQDCRVRAGARIGRGTALGDNTEVEANAVVENSVVLSDVTVGAGTVLRDCIIGENVTIGPNTTVEGGRTDLVVENEVHDEVRFGAAFGDGTDVGSAVTVLPGTLVGTKSNVASGTTLHGEVESEAIVRRG